MATEGVIRQATLADVPALWGLVRAYTAEIAPGGLQPQERATRRSLTQLVAHPSGLVLTRDDEGQPAALLAASIGASPWADVPVADYMIFYLAPSLRGGRNALALLRAFEEWADSQGAKVLGASDTGSQLSRLLTHSGYAPVEQKFSKVMDS